MLHRINLPDCTQHLDWIVRLQSDLLHALCDPNITDTAVTVDWVKMQRPDIDSHWMESFCGWKIEEKSMLARMQAVAALSPTDKQALITHYQNNLRYPEAFENTIPPPPATTPLPVGLSDGAISAYRSFFRMFYAPIFYRDKGYPINAPDLYEERFTKDKYLEVYHAVNPDLNVCPLCDGGMDGAELDHWLAQKHLPELNCHPQNLVEICGACNSRTNKGEKLALDASVAEPFAKWFHPYLRPAVGNFEIDWQSRRVRLISDDANTQERLNNLGRLINLGTRWSRAWQIQMKVAKKTICDYVRHRKQAFDEDSLRAKIETWKDDAEAEIGLVSHALVKVRFLTSALDENSNGFEELRTCAEEEHNRVNSSL